MGVRGTEFVVKSEIHDLKDVNKVVNHSSGTLPPAGLAGANSSGHGTTQVAVLQGQVDVGKRDFNAAAYTAGRNPASSGVVTLQAGSQLITSHADGKVGTPQTMSAPQMNAISTEAKVVDNTFQKAVVIENASNHSSEEKSGDQGRSPASTHDSGASVAPEAVHEVLASAEVPLAPPPAVKPADLNIPGALGATQIFNQPAINTQGTLKRLHIVITTN
jgi:hypothetical protein